jgi:hypothetical protein
MLVFTSHLPLITKWCARWLVQGGWQNMARASLSLELSLTPYSPKDALPHVAAPIHFTAGERHLAGDTGPRQGVGARVHRWQSAGAARCAVVGMLIVVTWHGTARHNMVHSTARHSTVLDQLVVQ